MSVVMQPNRNPHMTDEEFELYVKEYAEWLDTFMLDPDAWWKEFDEQMENK